MTRANHTGVTMIALVSTRMAIQFASLMRFQRLDALRVVLPPAGMEASQ